MKKRSFQHRSVAWRHLIGEEEKKPEWVRRTLLPLLLRETGLKWKTSGSQMLHSEDCLIFLPEKYTLDVNCWKEVIQYNPVLQRVKNLYSVIDLESDLGYFLKDSFGKNEKDCWEYSGFWALNIEKIHRRGSLMGKKFGL